MNYEFKNYFDLFERDFYDGLKDFTRKESPTAGGGVVRGSFDQNFYYSSKDNRLEGSPLDGLQTFSRYCSKNASKRALWKPEEKPKLKHACSNELNGYAEFRTSTLSESSRVRAEISEIDAKIKNVENFDKISKKTDTPGLWQVFLSPDTTNQIFDPSDSGVVNLDSQGIFQRSSEKIVPRPLDNKVERKGTIHLTVPQASIYE
jgi:hypothetical protein